MYLNTIKPAKGAKKNPKRVGRGIGSGLGKTCGRGHKGQHARAGGYHKVGFEGGQTPVQRRLPKFGFNSLTKNTVAEVRLYELEKISMDRIDLLALKTANIINHHYQKAKVILSGEIKRPIVLIGIKATIGAQKAIEAVGGKIEA